VSLEEIAEEAGVTKGAIYSNFDSKEELLLAVAASQAIDLDPALLSDPTVALPELFTIVAGEIARMATSEEQRRLAPRELELSTLALTSEKVRDTLVALGRMQRGFLSGLIHQRAEQQGLTLRLPADELATIALALARGLMQQRFSDPESVPEQYFADAFSLLSTTVSDAKD
jgi:AcrR family transcriptional regulator